MGQREDAIGGLPGPPSVSSLSSTPRSFDWSCTFILSLLLIRHTELLEHTERHSASGTSGSRSRPGARLSLCHDSCGLSQQNQEPRHGPLRRHLLVTNLRRLPCAFVAVAACWLCLSSMDCSLRHCARDRRTQRYTSVSLLLNAKVARMIGVKALTHVGLFLFQLLQKILYAFISDVEWRLTLHNATRTLDMSQRVCRSTVKSVPAAAGAHRVAAGLHVAQLLGQNAAGVGLTPVRCGVQRRPAVKVHSRHVHSALRQQPAQREQSCVRQPPTCTEVVKHLVESVEKQKSFVRT